MSGLLSDPRDARNFISVLFKDDVVMKHWDAKDGISKIFRKHGSDEIVFKASSISVKGKELHGNEAASIHDDIVLCKYVGKREERRVTCDVISENDVKVDVPALHHFLRSEIPREFSRFREEMSGKEKPFTSLETKNSPELAWFMNASDMKSIKKYVIDVAQLASIILERGFEFNESKVKYLDVGAEDFDYRRKEVASKVKHFDESIHAELKRNSDVKSTSLFTFIPSLSVVEDATTFNVVAKNLDMILQMIDPSLVEMKLSKITRDFPRKTYKKTNAEIYWKKLNYQDIGTDFHFTLDRAFRLAIRKGVIPLKMQYTTLPYSELDRLSKRSSTMRKRGMWKVGRNGEVKDIKSIGKAIKDLRKGVSVNPEGDPWSFFNRELETVRYVEGNKNI